MSNTQTTDVVLEAGPDAVFDTLTDLAHLPEGNAVIRRVLELPPRVEVGAEWVVELHALGRTWPSRSRIEVIDPTARRFTYHSRTDDGNPSLARWTWVVADDPPGSRVTVTWDLHAATFWRRVLLARIRARQLARTEIPASLRALGVAARHRPGATTASHTDTVGSTQL